MTWLDGKDAPNILNDVFQKNRPTIKNPNDAVVAQNISNIYKRHPAMPAGVVLGLAEGNADTAMVDMAAQQAAKQAADKYTKEATTRKDDGYGNFSPDKLVQEATKGVFAGTSWVLGNTIGKIGLIKNATRAASALLDTGKDLTQNVASIFAGEGEGAEAFDPRSRNFGDVAGIKDFFDSTALGALQSGDDQGTGFFLGGKAEENRAEAARRFRGEINDHTWTIGREAGSSVFTPGSKPYMYLSGIIDAGVAIGSDPTTFFGGGHAAEKAIRMEIPALKTLDEIKLAGKLAMGTAGILSTAEQHVIDNSKFFQWLDKSSEGVRIVTRLTGETNETKILEGMGWKITPDQARELASTTDKDVVRGLIAEQAVRLSDETTRGFVPFATDARQLPYALVERTPARRIIQNSKWLTETPSKFLLVNGNGQERSGAIKNVLNWVKTMGIDPYSDEGAEVMKTAFDSFVSTGTKVDAKRMHRMFVGDPDTGTKGIIQIVLEKNGVKQKHIDSVLVDYTDSIEKLRAYAMDTTGEVNDGSFMKNLLSYMNPQQVYDLKAYFKGPEIAALGKNATQAQIDTVINSLPDDAVHLFGPAALADLVDNVMVLPDPRVVRSLTTDNPFMKLRGGKQTGSMIIELFQTEIWKPYALSTFGFIMRNSIDAQLRMAISGVSTDNPIDFFLIAMRKYGLGTLGPEGSLFKDAGEAIANGAQDLFEMTEFAKGSTHQWVGDPEQALNRLYKTKNIDVVSIDQPAYRLALNEELRRIHASPELRMLARVSHLPEDRQIKTISEFLNNGSEEANAILRTLQRYAEDGFRVGVPGTGRRKTVVKFDDWKNLTTEEIVGLWYEKLGKSQVENIISQGNDELKVMAGYAHVPDGPWEIMDEATVRSRMITGGRPQLGDVLNEIAYYNKKGDPVYRTWLVYERENVPGVGRQFKVMPVKDTTRAFEGVDGALSAQDVLKKQVLDHGTSMLEGRGPKLPKLLKMKQRVVEDTRSPAEKLAGGALNLYQAPSKWFFNSVVPKAVEMAERSPAWRMTYYNTFAENVNLLEASEARQLLVDIADHTKRALPNHFAKNPEGALARYVGGKQVLANIRAQADEAIAGTGIGTRSQLQTYAATLASEKMQELLFDATSKSNIEDALRLVAPFGAAWREVFGHYGKVLAEDPRRVRRVQQVVRGLENFDPDQDGRGVIWTDPISKVKMFTFTGSSLAIKAITTLSASAGYGAPVTGASVNAPLKQLSAGLQVIPGVGPAVQIAAGWLFDHVEPLDQDYLRKFFTPYGPTTVDKLIPGYLTKAYSALFSSPGKLDTIYANTWADTFSYLCTTGQYDLSNADDVERMATDARQTGRIMTAIRAVSQFVGPTSGTVSYKADLEKGDAYANSLVAAFHDLEAENYDTAVGKFIDIFGSDAMIYMGSKTKVNPDFGGLEASKEFGNWEKKNTGLINFYKKTAAYLAPGGSDFAFETWTRQLSDLKRFRISPIDTLKDAQKKIGSALYVDFKKDYPSNPNEEERQELKDKRQELHDKYTGFPVVSQFNAGEFDTFISQLGELVKDKRTKGNKTAGTIKKYLAARTEQLTMLKDDYNKKSLAGENVYVQDARGTLWAYGNKLAEENPDFARIWQRELQQEVEE